MDWEEPGQAWLAGAGGTMEMLSAGWRETWRRVSGSALPGRKPRCVRACVRAFIHSFAANLSERLPCAGIGPGEMTP